MSGVHKTMNVDLGKASSFSLTQKSRHFTQTSYGGVMCLKIMRKLILLIPFLWCNLLIAASEFDSVLAKEISQSYLQSYFREQPEREPKDMIWSKFIISSVTDANGRKFIFVSFMSKHKNIGAVMYLEQCPDTLIPSWYGASKNVEKELANFNNIAGDKTADYPGGCWTHENDT